MFKMVDYINEERARAANMTPCVSLRCDCSRFAVTSVPLDLFQEVSDNHCVLKDGASVECTLCGSVHTSDDKYISLENQHSGIKQTRIVKCPVCGSVDVKSVTVPEQMLLHTVYAPNALSQYECKKCFNRW